MNTVAIHQPNLFPWLGYFDKINKADKFIFLDDVVINTKTPNWFKRVMIVSGGKEFAFTLPLVKPDGSFIEINKVELHKDDRLLRKCFKTLEQSYSRSEFFDSVFPLIEAFFDSTENFAERNIQFIKQVSAKLELETIFHQSSEFNLSSKSNELLIELTKLVNGDTYLSGGGSADYQNDELFSDRNIQVIYQNYSHPIYKQQVKGDAFLKAFRSLML